MKRRLLILLTLCIICSSCIYRMPDEDSYSLIPRTNNPTFIGTDTETATTNQAAF